MVCWASSINCKAEYGTKYEVEQLRKEVAELKAMLKELGQGLISILQEKNNGK